MNFSTPKKQLIVGKYSTEYRELVRAYMFGSIERANNLCLMYETGDEEQGISAIKVSDLRILLELAQDYAATYKLLNLEIHQNLDRADSGLQLVRDR